MVKIAPSSTYKCAETLTMVRDVMTTDVIIGTSNHCRTKMSSISQHPTIQIMSVKVIRITRIKEEFLLHGSVVTVTVIYMEIMKEVNRIIF